MIEEDLIIRAVHEFRGCIECSRDHLTSVTYFHTPACKRGAGLSLEVFQQRLRERLDYLDSHPARPLWITPMGRCNFCNNRASGTLWTKYHRDQARILSQVLVCEDHATMEDSSGRETGYTPEKAFDTIFDIERFFEVQDA